MVFSIIICKGCETHGVEVVTEHSLEEGTESKILPTHGSIEIQQEIRIRITDYGLIVRIEVTILIKVLVLDITILIISIFKITVE